MKEFPPPGYVPAESAVSGIIVFKPAPEVDRLEEVVDFRCPQCGGETAYSVADGGLTCTYCGYHEAPQGDAVGLEAESFEFTVATVEQSVNGWGVDRTELQCQSCSSHISIPAGSLTATCPFCGSNKVINQRARQDLLRPRFLVPFKVDENRCHAITKEWLGSSWMVPKQLRAVASIDSFAAMFLPYWTFGSTASASWRAQVGHTVSYTDSKGRTQTRTEWRWESGQVRREFQDLLVRGTERISTHLLEKVGRFDLKEMAAYEPAFLAGTQAQAYEVTLEDAWERARHRMREITRQNCHSQASTSQVRSFSMQLDFQEESWRYILLPVYINTYRYENEPYQLLINGQTGKIAGQRPVDWRKVGFVAAGLISPGILVFLFLILLFPESLESGGAVLSFVLFGFGLIAAAIIAGQAQKMDDI